MDAKEYRQTLEIDLKGRTYRLARQITRTDGTSAPAGMVVRVIRKWRGVGLETSPCECCGVSFVCMQVDPDVLGERVE